MSEALRVIEGAAIGGDIGGSKTHLLADGEHQPARYDTKHYADAYGLLDEYFDKLGFRPEVMELAFAGDVHPVTGEVKMTNAGWPVFSPRAAAARYRGTRFITTNDLVATLAGSQQVSGTELTIIKPGNPIEHDVQAAISVSTGIGVAFAKWVPELGTYVYLGSEGGHIGWQPKNRLELDYLASRRREELQHDSAEKATSGSHGIGPLAQYFLRRHPAAHELREALNSDGADTKPTGMILREFAETDHGPSTIAAQETLQTLAGMIASFMRDMALTIKPRGGIFLGGSPMVELGQYFAKKTDFIHRFVLPGAQHHEMLAEIPIYLVNDPFVAVKGALALALAAAA